MPQVVGAASARVGIESGVADGRGASGEVGQDGGAGPFAEPVQGGARGAGRDNRVVHCHQRGRDLLTAGAEQLSGAAAQRAGLAAAAFVELVFESAVSADVAGRQPCAVGAGPRVRSGWANQAPLGVAAAAGPAVAQCRGVAGVADRSLRPVRCRRPVLAAAGADGGAPRRAAGADRTVGAGEAARPTATAGRVLGLRLPEAAVADVWLITVGASGDPTDPPAPAATPVRTVGAAGAECSAVATATGDGFDDRATCACLGELATSAAGANPRPCGGSGQPLAFSAAEGAARRRQRAGSLGT